jgi:hypothetical protein
VTICKAENCKNTRLKGRLCSQHEGKYFCKFENCEKTPLKGMYCLDHGGQKSTCKVENCEKLSVRNGDSKIHRPDSLVWDFGLYSSLKQRGALKNLDDVIRRVKGYYLKNYQRLLGPQKDYKSLLYSILRLSNTCFKYLFCRYIVQKILYYNSKDFEDSSEDC